MSKTAPRTLTRRAVCALAAAMAAATALPAYAQASDPAAGSIEKFETTLIDVMKRAKTLGPKGRYDALKAPIERAFYLPAMTRFAVGTGWSTVPANQQDDLVAAFTRMTVATYAHNFDGYSNEKFELDKVDTRGPDKLVHTRLVDTGSPTVLAYRMRESGGSWKVIDVYYNSAVSSLLGQRSEYSSTLSSGGAPALVKKLNAKADDLLKGK